MSAVSESACVSDYDDDGMVLVKIIQVNFF